MSDKICIKFKEPVYTDDIDTFEIAKKRARYFKNNEGGEFVVHDSSRELCGDEQLISYVVSRLYSYGSKLCYQAKSIAKNNRIAGLDWMLKE